LHGCSDFQRRSNPIPSFRRRRPDIDSAIHIDGDGVAVDEDGRSSPVQNLVLNGSAYSCPPVRFERRAFDEDAIPRLEVVASEQVAPVMLLYHLRNNCSHLGAELHASETAAGNHLMEQFPEILGESVVVEEVRRACRRDQLR
jgi:hypothetical protein